MRSLVRPGALIGAYFDSIDPPAVRETAQALWRCVTNAAPQLVSTLKWGNLVLLHGGRHAIAIVAHRQHVNLQVFAGAALAERFPALEGVGKGMRHLKCRAGEPLDEALIAALVAAALAEMG